MSAAADPIRLATFDTDLSRDGPGLLLRDIMRGSDEQVGAVIKVIDRSKADILALQGIDWDWDLRALQALNARLERPFPYLFSLRPNSGMATDQDMDGDGRKRGAADAQGFGDFPGQGGLALLSRFAFDPTGAVDFSALLWRDFPGATLPVHANGAPFPSASAIEVQRLSSRGHWAVPVRLDTNKILWVLTFHATPPVFDGPEDRNGLRNADEITLWRTFLNGKLDAAPPTETFALLGNANLDPVDGDGITRALVDLIAQTPLTDPMPASPGAAKASLAGGANATHRGDPALDTADWRDDPGPGNLRVDYVLPSEDLTVVDAGVLWPDPDSDRDFAALVATASDHRLVWVDIEVQR